MARKLRRFIFNIILSSLDKAGSSLFEQLVHCRFKFDNQRHLKKYNNIHNSQPLCMHRGQVIPSTKRTSREQSTFLFPINTSNTRKMQSVMTKNKVKFKMFDSTQCNVHETIPAISWCQRKRTLTSIAI